MLGTTSASSGPGRGGGYSESLLEVSALGSVESVTVGTGGAAGNGNSPGGAGGSSSFGGLVTARRVRSEHGGALEQRPAGSAAA
ncbi:hypothetical protein [Streptomyces sp. 11-1-2]|uniref:hypothetical protein n=2 Tax=unclassified Streptomyces TaxID=2593676 RepID=UPI000E76D631|nr:hypothetical protein [Streptomyces sp. 11-1-2]